MKTPDVLIVDDDEAFRAALAEFLELRGFLVRQACDGREALEMAADHLPQVILLDLTMPGMDGWSTLRELQGHRDLSRIPVVIVSADPVVPRHLPTIAKPCEIDRLVELVRSAAAS